MPNAASLPGSATASLRASHRAAPAPPRVRPRSRFLSSWPEWSSLAAGIWSAVYTGLGLRWTFGHGTFPFGEGPASGPASSLWAGLDAERGAPIVALLGAMGVLAATQFARPAPGRSRVIHVASIAYAWFMAVTLLVLVPDARAIVAAAYAPIFLIGKPLGVIPAELHYSAAIPWPIINQLICIGGGFLWLGAALASSRRARGACVACGRGDEPRRWTAPSAAHRWGTWAAVVASILPLPYAITRAAWALGLPLGATSDTLAIARGEVFFPAGPLAVVAIVGALLTLGLIFDWGVVMPRWLPFLGGRRVPPALAIVPASLVSVLVFTAGLGVVRDAVLTAVRGGGGAPWAPIDLVGYVWPLWGLALGAATLAYHYRRRGACPHCGRMG